MTFRFFVNDTLMTLFGPLCSSNQTSQRCNIKLSIYYCHFFVIFSSTELQPFFMHNKYILIFLLAFDVVSFFPLYLNASLQRHKNFLFYERKKYIRQKRLNNIMSWNQLKMNWNENLLINTLFESLLWK